MVRAILTPDTKTVSFDVPENYIGQKIEIIAFEIDEELEEFQRKTMAEFWVTISKEKADKLNEAVD